VLTAKGPRDPSRQKADLLRCLGLARLLSRQAVDDHSEIGEELIAARWGENLEDAVVDTPDERLAGLENPPALLREADCVSSGIFLCPPSLQQTLLEHAPNDIGERGTVDARAINELRLAQAFMLRDRQQHRILPRRQIGLSDLTLKHVTGALSGTMKEMNWRTV
jgi:hypothetical protein